MSEVKVKKGNLLTIEKELLGSYMEAVADCKRLKEIVKSNTEYYGDKEAESNVENEFNTIIDKHVERIRSSGIWEWRSKR